MYDLMVTPAEVKNFDTTSFCRLMEIDTAEFKKEYVMQLSKNSRSSFCVPRLLKPQIRHGLKKTAGGFLVLHW